MKTRLVKNLSANTLQLIINQLLGLVIFYLLSTGLDKESFGQINLALALLLAIFNILSFGIDQIAVRKIASGEEPKKILALYLSHVVLTGLLFYGLLFAGRILFTTHANYYNLVLLLGAGKLAIYFSMPFKQSAIGMEHFKLLARMSVISNLARGSALAAFAAGHSITISSVIIIFVVGDVLELLSSIYLFRRNTGIMPTINYQKNSYIKLLKESLPQLGVVIITSALARFDWIFIGFTVSATKLAEYSFAYKVFELSTLPLLAISPLLIPKFTRLFKQHQPDAVDLKLLLKIEMIIAAFTVLLLNICWVPVIDPLTEGKYGVVNERTLFLLSLCIPLQYLCNFFWTIYFAKGQLKLILNAFITTLAVNITGDIILVPLYKNEGAAIACLAGFIAQAVFYLSKNEVRDLSKTIFSLPICTDCACLCFFTAKILFTNVFAAGIFSALFFITLLFITKQIGPNDWRRFRKMIYSPIPVKMGKIYSEP